MTPVLKILTQYCAIYVDDIRLQELAIKNPPLYARKMCGYFIPAISLFTIPAEMTDYLLGNSTNPNFIEPNYNQERYIVSETQTTTFEINLGENFIGYELFSASIISMQGNEIISTATNLCTYDNTTGIITVNATTDNPVNINTIFDFDFYTDGYFVNDLTNEIMNILGFCFELVWQERFNMDWLSNVSKLEDKSFFEQNRANKIRADYEKLDKIRQKLAGEMRRFEQNKYYKKIISPSQRLKF